MAAFLSELNVTKVAEAGFGHGTFEYLCQKYPHAEQRIMDAYHAGRALWRYNSDLVFMSNIVGKITARTDDITDFSSVPRTPLTFWIAGDTAHASAGIHDELCNYWIPDGRITWREAADVFDEAMKSEGVPGWRRMLMRWAVTGADPENKWEPPE